MFGTLFVALACATPADAPEEKGEPPAKKELFAKEGWYKDQKGKEQDFVGVLRYVKAPGIGIGRFNPYRLEMEVKGKKDTREVYVGGKPELLKAYVGRKVKITGKPVELEVVGRVHREVWPARIELVKAKEGEPEEKPGKTEPVALADEEPPAKRVKVLARTFFRPADGGRDPQQKVLRGGEDAAGALGMPGKAKEATAQLARMFKVDDIDWKKQMVVVVTGGLQRTGGYSVEVTDLKVSGKALTVKWKLNRPKPGGIVTAALTHPGTAVLTERFAGPVKFDPPAKGKGGAKEK